MSKFMTYQLIAVLLAMTYLPLFSPILHLCGTHIAYPSIAKLIAYFSRSVRKAHELEFTEPAEIEGFSAFSGGISGGHGDGGNSRSNFMPVAKLDVIFICFHCCFSGIWITLV